MNKIKIKGVSPAYCVDMPLLVGTELEFDCDSNKIENVPRCSYMQIYLPYNTKLHHKCDTCITCKNLEISNKIQYDAIRNYFMQTYGDNTREEWPNPVQNVCDDGSIPKGIEIITKGTIFIPETFYRSHWYLCDKIKKISFLCGNNYTGIHYHILTPQWKEQHNVTTYNIFNLPQYTLYNYMYLANVISPWLFYLSTLGDNARYSVFKENLIITHILDNKDMLKLIYSAPKGGKYLAFTPYLSLYRNGLKAIHVESRYMPTFKEPSIITLHAIVNTALVRKAMTMPYNVVYDITDNILIDAAGLSIKINNRGVEKRGALVTLSNKDKKKILEIGKIVLEELADTIAEIDPFGNSLEVLSKAQTTEDLLSAYSSTRKFYDIMRHIDDNEFNHRCKYNNNNQPEDEDPYEEEREYENEYE